MRSTWHWRRLVGSGALMGFATRLLGLGRRQLGLWHWLVFGLGACRLGRPCCRWRPAIERSWSRLVGILGQRSSEQKFHRREWRLVLVSMGRSCYR